MSRWSRSTGKCWVVPAAAAAAAIAAVVVVVVVGMAVMVVGAADERSTIFSLSPSVAAGHGTRRSATHHAIQEAGEGRDTRFARLVEADGVQAGVVHAEVGVDVG